MSDNPFGYVDPLSDTEGQRALDETPPPHVLTSEDAEKATVGWVKKYVAKHQQWCPALRVLRKWSMVACVLIGATLALQVVGLLSARALLTTIVDEAVAKSLTRFGVPHAAAPADPAPPVHYVQGSTP